GELRDGPLASGRRMERGSPDLLPRVRHQRPRLLQALQHPIPDVGPAGTRAAARDGAPQSLDDRRLRGDRDRRDRDGRLLVLQLREGSRSLRRMAYRDVSVVIPVAIDEDPRAGQELGSTILLDGSRAELRVGPQGTGLDFP